MGENPWKNADYLLQEKCAGKVYGPSAAMARGTGLESETRKCYERKFGIRVAAACLQSTRYEWLRASVDGLAAAFKAPQMVRRAVPTAKWWAELTLYSKLNFISILPP